MTGIETIQEHEFHESGVTLVELLIALAVASLLMLGVIAAFQTVQRTASIGEAREQIYQNGRVALDLMAKEIKNAYIDHRSRDFVFVSADGLGGRASSILEFSPNPPETTVTEITYRGLGNAQTPHGIDPTGDHVFGLYADRSYGSPTYTPFTIKAIDNLSTLPGGPPDRLDFTSLTPNFPGNVNLKQSRICEVRYCVTTETFVDDYDNDGADGADAADSVPPGAGGLTGLGDLISYQLHPAGGKIKALSLFHLRRGLDVDVDKNSYSAFDLATGDGNPADPQGRYPAREFDDFEEDNNGESIGSYIYDVQFEFYGRIALSLDSYGRPNTWGVGWGRQDVRGEDTGLIDNGDTTLDDGEGPDAIDDGSVETNLLPNGSDDDNDGWVDDYDNEYARPEPNTPPLYLRTNGVDDDGDGVVDDGPEHAAGRPESHCIIKTGGTNWNAYDRTGGGFVDLTGGIFFIPSDTEDPDADDQYYRFDTADPDNDVYRIVEVVSGTVICLDRPYSGAPGSNMYYRVIEPAQANGLLDKLSGGYPEDVGPDGLQNDPLDNLNDDEPPTQYASPLGIPNNVSDNDNVTAEPSIGEGNSRLDSRVMGIWDSRSVDPRNPRRAEELNGWDDDNDYGDGNANSGLAYNGNDDDLDGAIDDRLDVHYEVLYDKWGNPYGNPIDLGDGQFTEFATAEPDDGTTPSDDESNNLLDDDPDGADGMADDRSYEPAGKPEGVDEPDEAIPDNDSLPKAVRITIVVRDSAQAIDPVVLTTTVWLSTAK